MEMILLALVVAAIGGSRATRRRGPSASEQRRRRALHAFDAACAEVASAIGFAKPTVVDLPGESNVLAWPDRIGIDAAWIADVIDRQCRDAYCASQVLRGIAAHEMAHVLYADRVREAGPVSRFQELRADFFAGWLCGQLGFGSADIQALVAELAQQGCGTHPLPESRVYAVWRGDQWREVPFTTALQSNFASLWLEARRDCVTRRVAA